mgnify:CR=1 FL=1
MRLTNELKKLGCTLIIKPESTLKGTCYFEASIKHFSGIYRISSRAGVCSKCHVSNRTKKLYRGFDSYWKAMNFIAREIKNEKTF